jgi:hypothetical protein
MLRNLQFWVLSVLAAACLAAVAVNILLASNNQGLRLRMNERAQLIGRSATAAVVYRQMVQALAQLSVRNHDPRLRAVLARQGLKVTVRPAPTQSGAERAPLARSPAALAGAHHE